MKLYKRILLIVALVIIAGQIYVLATETKALGAILSIISMVLIILVVIIKGKEATKEDETSGLKNEN